MKKLRPVWLAVLIRALFFTVGSVICVCLGILEANHWNLGAIVFRHSRLAMLAAIFFCGFAAVLWLVESRSRRYSWDAPKGSKFEWCTAPAPYGGPMQCSNGLSSYTTSVKATVSQEGWLDDLTLRLDRASVERLAPDDFQETTK